MSSDVGLGYGHIRMVDHEEVYGTRNTPEERELSQLRAEIAALDAELARGHDITLTERYPILAQARAVVGLIVIWLAALTIFGHRYSQEAEEVIKVIDRKEYGAEILTADDLNEINDLYNGQWHHITTITGPKSTPDTLVIYANPQ